MTFSYRKRTSFLFGLILIIVFLSSQSMIPSCPHMHKKAKALICRMHRANRVHQTVVRHHIAPSNTIFVFDLDDVILLIKKAKKAKFGLYLLVRPDVWPDFAKIRKHSGHADAMVKQNKKPGLVKRLKRIKQSKTPIEGMIEILRELKQKGYVLHIASNMTRTDFEFYQKQYPGIFSLFDQAFVVEGATMPQKPSKQYFYLYREKYPTSKQHFFIDDKRENCDAAGFAYTHVFKNPEQLRLDLTARGVL